ncbi:hypothetical protein AURDEDRAFT_168094 [Auricularia subglabra TFB-10046 SS5]|nr:hypothetical protein AURDEDRAFT_168094 [Auricularia subglabra TFB-10046 SS5]
MNWTEATIEAAHMTTPERARLDVYYYTITNYIEMVGYAVLIWDHFLTFSEYGGGYFGEEMDLVLIYVFIFLRYFAPLGYTVRLCSLLISPAIWTPEICARYVVFEGCLALIVLAMVALMMMIRVYALCNHSLPLLATLGTVYIFQFSLSGWLLRARTPSIRPYGTHEAGCMLIFSKEVGSWVVVAAWLPVVYDSIVFSITLYALVPLVRRRKALEDSPGSGQWISTLLLRDGCLFFFVILVSSAAFLSMIGIADVRDDLSPVKLRPNS